MALTGGKAAWTQSPPSAYDIVAAYYPENGTRDAGPKLRPTLCLQILRGKSSGAFACKVAYGTRTLNIVKRQTLDLIIQAPAHLQQMGLARPTRFDLDCIATLPWNEDFFGCWTGRPSPKIGSLTEDYIREYAFMMMKRQSV